MTTSNLDDLIAGVRSGDRAMLARAITIVESTRPDHREAAETLLEACLPPATSSFRMGVTGIPGVGKSTFIDALGMMLAEAGRKIAVLAVDPTSDVSRGSILGDKTRMQRLAAHANAFVRPSPSGGRSGGIAHRTREAIFLCEAAGFETVFVETVGAGQAETAVHSMVDLFLLLALAGAGDELQGIKRGIVEMADAVVITKADGENVASAEEARAQFQYALQMFPPTESGWKPRVHAASALTGKGLNEVLRTLDDYEALARESGYFEQNRRRQGRYWLRETLERRLLERLYDHPVVRTSIQEYERKVEDGEISAAAAAEAVLEVLHAEGTWSSRRDRSNT